MKMLLICFAIFLAFNVPAFADRGDGPPNVLFIMVDDLNDWIGCLGGHPDSKTPNIDRLANRGVLFERAYCAAPACNPSRAAILTGIRPSTSGVYLNSQPWRPAMPDVVTMPQLFKKHGYHVIGGGKIYHGRFSDPQSWDYYFRKGGEPKPEDRPVNGIKDAGSFDWGPLDAEDSEMSDNKIVDWAIEELHKKHDKPLFLACGIFRPHLPWYVPKKYFDRYPLDQITLPKIKSNDLDDVPAAGVEMARRTGDHEKVIQSGNYKKAVQGYLASISFADDQVGRLLSALEKSDYADNTIVVLLGDHGWHLGEKSHWRKFSLWEEAGRSPLMFFVPGLTSVNGRCKRTVSFMDIYPTLASLCDLPLPDHLEGANFKPLLKAPKQSWNHVAVTTNGRNNHAIRSDRWRYIRYADGGEELYDHDNDPMEWQNLASDEKYKDIVAELVRHLPKKNAPDARR